MRYLAIDRLRALAMIFMTITHISAYFLHIPLARFLWNSGEVSVFLFIFCSYFLFQKRNPTPTTDIKHFYKRLKRLLVPYYLYLLAEFLRSYFQEGKIISWQKVLSALTLTGGYDLNWLVLLFCYFIVLFPLVETIYQKSKGQFLIVGLLLTLISILSYFFTTSTLYRLTMILGWLGFLFALKVMYFDQKSYFSSQKKIIYLVFMFAFVGFFTLNQLGFASVNFYDHKYPPDLYYLSFGVLLCVIFYQLAQRFSPPKYVDQFLQLLSKYSYEYYFLHNLAITTFWVWYWAH